MIEEFSKAIRLEPTPEDKVKLKEFEAKFEAEIVEELENLQEEKENKDN